MAVIRRTYKNIALSNLHTVLIEGRCEIGATGAVGALHGSLFSVARASAGTYNITLDVQSGIIDFYNVQASVVSSTNLLVKVASVNTSTGVIQVVCLQAADGATATDPASGSSLCFSISVKNRSAS